MNPSKKSIIYLTGFMGSGKSTLAPILANTLGYTFIDMDLEIERAAGKTVSAIFHDHGETYFREIEHQVLERVSKGNHCVISLGGGTVATSSNLSIAKSTGIMIYLKTDIDNIFHRMKNKTDRPVLQDSFGDRLSEDELRKRIADILALREPFYIQADITIETDDRRIGVTVDKIVHALSGKIE
jgi:shikimate kinase